MLAFRAMRFRTALHALLLGAVLASPGAFAAGRRPTTFQEPQQMSEEELEAAKQRSKNRLNGFDEKMEEKPKPFPWMLFSLAMLSFLVAVPFGFRAYRNTTKEIQGTSRAVKTGLDEAPN